LPAEAFDPVSRGHLTLASDLHAIEQSGFNLSDPASADTWVVWDGHARPDNSEVSRNADRLRAEWFHSNFTMFTLAYYYTADDRYARKAVSLARRWWLDDETAMLPKLDFSQGDRAPSKRHFGIIEMRGIAMALDAVALLKRSRAWDEARDGERMQRWCSAYADWLDGSEEGRSPNNHRWFYMVQLAAVRRCANPSVASNASHPASAARVLAEAMVSLRSSSSVAATRATGRRQLTSVRQPAENARGARGVSLGPQRNSLRPSRGAFGSNATASPSLGERSTARPQLHAWAPAACIGADGSMAQERKIPKTDVARSRALHYHYFAAHALLFMWRAAENLGMNWHADELRVTLPKTIELLGLHRIRAMQSSAGSKPAASGADVVELVDGDHFSVAEMTERMTLLCQWLLDLGGREEKDIIEAVCETVPAPPLMPDSVLHSGMLPFGNVVW